MSSKHCLKFRWKLWAQIAATIITINAGLGDLAVPVEMSPNVGWLPIIFFLE